MRVVLLTPGIVAAAAVGVLGWGASLAAQGISRVDLEVSRTLVREGKVCSCVVLQDTSRKTASMSARAREFKKAQDDFLATLPADSVRVRYRYRYSPVLLVDILDPAVLATVDGSPQVARGALDAQGSGGLNQSRALIHANATFDLGVQGNGRVFAVLDTGVDSDHPDLAAAVIHQHHFLSSGGNVGPGAEDGHGHGTNVSGIVASRGTVAPRGVAPGALLVAIKVLDDQNRGFISDWAAGVEYVVDLHTGESGIKVDAINMSLVSDAQFASACDSSFVAFANACQAAAEAGIAVFASSGNTGSTTQLTSPACLSSVISVGAVPDNLPDRMSSFTARNNSLDLLAPGDPITSTGMGGGTSTFAGTSQACPHAVAAACLLRGISPAMPPGVIEKVLKATGVVVSDTVVGRSFPRIDALDAVNAAQAPGDCNENGLSDYIDIHITETSEDADADGVPDECDAPVVARFRRGDVNASNEVDISDPIKTLLFLFSGDTASCLDAADGDDSGAVDLSDAIFLLDTLFRGGEPVPLPGLSLCGPDPTADSIDCLAYPGCSQ